jgi:hypothetical protein
MRGGVAGVDHGATIALDDGDGLAACGYEVGGSQSDDATADDDDVDGEIAVEFRERW